jgi:hypothetical protein
MPPLIKHVSRRKARLIVRAQRQRKATLRGHITAAVRHRPGGSVGSPSLLKPGTSHPVVPLKVINAELEKKGALEFDTRMDRGRPRKRLKEPMINGLRTQFYVFTP